MNIKRAISGIALTATVIIAVTGCEDKPMEPTQCYQQVIPADGSMPCGVVAPVVTDSLIVGDSVSWEAYMGRGGLDIPFYGYPGWRAGHALPFLRSLAGTDYTLIVAFGINDMKDGWTAEDEAAWTEMLSLAPRVKILLPWATAPANFPAMEAARSWMIAQGFPTQDWRDYVENDPSVPDTDGIHLANDSNGAWGINRHAADVRYSALMATAAA